LRTSANGARAHGRRGAAKRFQKAIGTTNESEAKQFQIQLNDQLQSVNGFKNFRTDREEQRQRELARQFTLESAKAEKGIYFITEYLRENLINPKTETLSILRMRLDNARRPSSISDASVNVLNNTNEVLDSFVRDNSLSSDYARIVATFGHSPTEPVAMFTIFSWSISGCVLRKT
jgi:hypothetical protein